MYKSLKTSVLFLLIILFVSLSYAVRQTPQQVMMQDESHMVIEDMTKSLKEISSIEYKQYIKTMGLGNITNSIEMHYYYKKPYHLRIDFKNGNNISIDIYRPDGMYEYFPISNIAYYREKWKDDKEVSFQLEDKMQDIIANDKYKPFKSDKFNNFSCEIIRSVDDDNGKIYEHKIWVTQIKDLNLPVKEEYLIDGEIVSTQLYEYISINNNINDNIFDLKASSNLKIYNVNGIPKRVADKNEAEKYVKFKVVIPKYIPKNFTMSEIYVIPPSKTPTVLITYISDTSLLYLEQMKTGKPDLIIGENDKIIKLEGMKFALKKLPNDSVSVRWYKDGIEFDVSGPYTLKDDMIKMIHNISGVWIYIGY